MQESIKFFFKNHTRFKCFYSYQFLFLLVLISTQLFSKVNAQQVGDSARNMLITRVNVGINAGTTNYALMRSASDRVTKKTPLVIGFHGVGETDTSIAAMVSSNGITKHGIANNIATGIMPKKIKNFRTGDSLEFNYLFLQRRTRAAPYTSVSLREILNHIPTLMPWVDTNNIFVYGISMGGGSASQFVKDANTDILKRIRGIVLMSSIAEAGAYTLTAPGQVRYLKTPIYCQWTLADTVGNVAAWNKKLKDSLNKYDPNHVTIYNYTISGNHGGWTAASGPARKQTVAFMWGASHNVNTIEWMASYINFGASIPTSTATKLGDSAYNMIVTQVKVTVNAGTWNYALMKSAKDRTQKTPLVIGLHGVDEVGFGIRKMVGDSGIWKQGLARNIAEGIMPAKFRNFRIGDSTEFNFIFPQRTVATMYTPEALIEILNYVKTTYSWIDTNNIFLYGYDIGGNAAGEPMVDGYETMLNGIRGFVLQSASYPHHNPAKRTLKQPNGMKDKRKPVYIQWSTSDATTGVAAWNNQLRDTLNKYRANQVTQYLHSAGHGGWTAASHPSRRQSVTFMWGSTYNVNTMEWMASYINYNAVSARQSGEELSVTPIQTNKLGEIIIYPNPVSSELILQDREGKKIVGGSYKIFNSGGVVIQEGTNKSVIAVNSLPSGVYIIQIRRGDQITTKQFIKK